MMERKGGKEVPSLEEWQKHFATAMFSGCLRVMIPPDDIESPIEKIAYMALAQMVVSYGAFHYTVKRQAHIKDYRVDFLISYSDKNIVIECDGHEFHEKTKQQASRDKKRDRELQKLGYYVLRYSGSDIVNDPEKICFDVQEIFGKPSWAPEGDEDGRRTT
jgi:very-short-patch-repair endonuclease